MRYCENELIPGTVNNHFLFLLLVSSYFSYKHCGNFIRSDACNNSSLEKNWVNGVTIAGVWVLATMFSTAILILNNYGKERSYHFYLWQSYCCLCLFVICVSYSCIFVKFLCGAHRPHHGAASRQRKLTITLFIMTIVSLLMWLPYAVATFLFFQSSLKFLSLQESFRLESSLRILYFMNSLVNPIVYAMRMPEFRNALLLLFKCQQRRNNNNIPLHAL